MAYTGEAPWIKGGPWRPAACLILVSRWMIRGSEFSNAEARSVTLSTVLQTVSWTLPASKADSSALGVTITHGCCCCCCCCCQGAGSDRQDSPLCPYHRMEDHLVAYRRKWPRRFRRNGRARPGVPLFPDANGGVCTKAGVTDTIRVAAKRQGQPLVDPGGLFLHTGHAMRVTGSQALSRAGLPEHTVALVAMWGSAAVLLYIRKAPLASTRLLSTVALTGWEQNQASTASTSEGLLPPDLLKARPR